MQSSAREPSMEDILASIKKVIAEEEEELRSVASPPGMTENESVADADEDVLELDEPLAPPADLGPPLLDETAAEASRSALEALTAVTASVPPPPPVNPLEEMIREMLKPILKQWLDEHLTLIVEEHVKREITRITGRPL